MEKERTSEPSRADLIQKSRLENQLKLYEIIQSTSTCYERDKESYQRISDGILEMLDGVDIFVLDEHIWSDKGNTERFDEGDVVIWEMDDLQTHLESLVPYKFEDDSYTPGGL